MDDYATHAHAICTMMSINNNIPNNNILHIKMETDNNIIIYFTNNVLDVKNIVCPRELRSGCACRVCSRTR